MLEHAASNRGQASPRGLHGEVTPQSVRGRQSVFPGVNTLKEQVPKSQRGNPIHLKGDSTMQSSTLTVTEEDGLSSQCRRLLTQYFMMDEQVET